MNNIQKLYQQGQSIWCDNISRQMINSGELERLIDFGVVGVTSNPTIFMKAITGSNDYDDLFQKLLADGHDTLSLYEGLVIPDIADAADALLPVYKKTNGVDGYVSLEVSPKLAYDTDATIAEARRLFARLNRPNVFIKVPATEEGIPAIEALIAEGVNVNVTLIFGIGVYEKVMHAYVAGLQKLDAAGGAVPKVASVASFFVSRIDSLIDGLLAEKQSAGADVDGLPGRAAIANARLAYARFQQIFDDGDAFAPLAAKGAMVQRPLWASTSTKDRNYRDTMYLDELVAPRSVNTLPPPTIEATLDHGRTEVTIFDDLKGAGRIMKQLAERDIHIDEVTEKLRRDGVDAFAKSFEELLANLEQKQELLRASS